MKTLKALFLGLVVVMMGLTACNSQSNEKIARVDTLMMPADTVNARIAKIMSDYVVLLRQDLLQDTTVLNTLGQTQLVVQDIENNKIDQAKTTLQNLIGSLEVYLTKNPDAALVPINVSYHQVETVDNIDTARAIAKAAHKAMEKGYYQAAKQILAGLTSEMIISTAYLPIVDYLQGLKVAAALLDENQVDKAMVVMQAALSRVVVTDVTIPLPILKAEVMIDEAARIDAKDHKHVAQVVNLLDNAKYQIKLAEAMGYGKHDKEFKELYKAIKDLKKSVKAQANSQPAFNKLHKKLKNFEHRLFPIKKK